MDSYDISVDTQSNLAYYEYDLRVLVAFLTIPYIEYGAGGQTKSLHHCRQYSVIWLVINLMTGFFGTQINYGMNFIGLNVYTILD